MPARAISSVSPAIDQDPDCKWPILHKLCDDILRLRRSDLASESFRLKLEIHAHERAVEQRNEQNREELRQKIKAVLCPPEEESGECPSPGTATSNRRQRKMKSKRRRS